jgi:hypothetical protein
VSYDIYFVRRDPGQSFEDALDATEESYDGDPGPLEGADLEHWDRITMRAQQILDAPDESATEMSRNLFDSATGIQLSMIADEVTITVPSERPDQDSVTLMAKVYALARVVEDETGLEGYDPQLQEPVTDPRHRLTGMHTTPSADRDDDDDDGAARGPGPVPAEQPVTGPPVPQAAVAARPRRWWEFWKQ